MEKLTNKQHTDYCEILNKFRCSAIDMIEELTKDYKNTLAEDIDSKLNDYHTHNEDLICKLENLRQENTILKKALELACETIKEIMPNKPMYICGSAIAERLGIPQTSEIKDYDYFIEQAKESIDGKIDN